MKFKKTLLSLAFVLVFGMYVVYGQSNKNINPAITDKPVVTDNYTSQNQKPTGQNVRQIVRGEDENEFEDDGGATQIATPPPINSTVPTQTAGPMMGSGSGSMMTGKYKNGSYTGSSADAFYGLVQVKAIIIGGKITDVQFLNYPQDNGSSLSRSNYAMPILKSEAIQAQSANVNIVSGATETSRAFIQSLSSALSQAV